LCSHRGIIHEFILPEHLFDTRYGARYRNLKWEPKLQAPTAQDKDKIVDELMVKTLFPGVQKKEPRMLLLGITELHRKIFNENSPYASTALASSLPKHPNYLGRLMRKWADINTNVGEKDIAKQNRESSCVKIEHTA
jgi:hypothetical protein